MFHRRNSQAGMRLALVILIPVSLSAFTPAGWVRDENRAGFVIEHPPGWKVETPASDMVIVHSPDSSRIVIIQGIMTKPGTTSREWLDGAPLRFLTLFPNSQAGPIVQRSRQPDESMMFLTYQSPSGPSRAGLLVALDRGAGMMYGIAAPANQFERAKHELLRILQSFSVTNPPPPPGMKRLPAPAAAPGKPNVPNVEYTRWSDPVEQAFSIEVPKGWTVKGGTLRKASVDVRQWLQEYSPDGQTMVFGSDPTIPGSFAVPNQTLAFAGFHEGSWYSPGYGVQMYVLRYQPGVVFGEAFARNLARGCAAFEVRERKERPDLSRTVNELYSRYGGGYVRMSVTHGEVSFSCQKNGRDFGGYVVAGTMLTEVAGMLGGNWVVQTLYGFLAPVDQTGLAAAVLAHGTETLQFNPQWIQMQQNVTMNTSRIVTETNHYISKLQSEAYWNRQRSQDRISQARSDANRGIVRVQDPNTGEVYEVANGRNYYWRHGPSGTIIGTNTYDPPNIDVTPLVQAPPR